jgi:hypothetical protein
MKEITKEIRVDASQEEVFNLLRNYFSMKGLKMVDSHEYLQVEFGSWFDVSFENERGKATIRIERNDISTLIFEFDFLRTYLMTFFTPIIIFLGISVLMGLSNIRYFWEAIVAGFIFGAIVGIAALILTWNGINKTKSKFINDVDKFLSLDYQR